MKKTHIMHHYDVVGEKNNTSICGIKSELYTDKTCELTCKNCRKYLRRFRPWKQEYILNGFYIEDDKDHEHYPFPIISCRCEDYTIEDAWRD